MASNSHIVPRWSILDASGTISILIDTNSSVSEVSELHFEVARGLLRPFLSRRGQYFDSEMRSNFCRSLFSTNRPSLADWDGPRWLPPRPSAPSVSFSMTLTWLNRALWSQRFTPSHLLSLSLSLFNSLDISLSCKWWLDGWRHSSGRNRWPFIGAGPGLFSSSFALHCSLQSSVIGMESSAIFIFLKELFLILCVANLFHVDDSHFQATPTDIHKLRHTHKHTYGLIPLDG